MKTLSEHKVDYERHIGTLISFEKEFVRQVQEISQAQKLLPVFPIQSRIKTWESIEEKLSRKDIDLENVLDLKDVVGLRILFLYERDADTFTSELKKHLDVLSVQDRQERLNEDRFGYQSTHLIARMPTEWTTAPTMRLFATYVAEIQVRTLAQHIWAAASHQLQYKHEESIPLKVRRAIHRVSALLETVDLEFDRVLQERDAYMGNLVLGPNSEINSDNISTILSKILPLKNAVADEPWGDLVFELRHFGISTVAQLEELIEENRSTMERDEERSWRRAKEQLDDGSDDEELGTDVGRVRRGVYFTHVGLVRTALDGRIGEENRTALFP